VRDLEGTSVDETHPAADAHRRLLGRATSPVLYGPDDAWRRFAYYVVVNHVGHVVATVAAVTGIDERPLWDEVAAVIVGELTRASAGPVAPSGASGPGVPPSERLRQALLGPELPAKANLLSTLLGRGEQPLYVAVPTPYRPAPPSAPAAPTP
jgi:siderophore synthetase component